MILQIIYLISLFLTNICSLSDNVKIFKRDYSNLHNLALINDIETVEWEEILSSNYAPDPNVLYFIQKCQKLLICIFQSNNYQKER